MQSLLLLEVELMETASQLLFAAANISTIASIIGSGINGNTPSTLVLPQWHSQSIASIIGSGINGNHMLYD